MVIYFPDHISADILARCKKGVNLIILGHIGPYQAREIHNGLMSGQVSNHFWIVARHVRNDDRMDVN